MKNNIFKIVMQSLAVMSLIFLFVGEANSGQVSLSWSPNSESDLAGYRVYVSTESGVYLESDDAGNVTNFIKSGLSENVTYFFVVTAYDLAGNESAFSLEVFSTISDLPPNAPTGLQASQDLADISGKISTAIGQLADAQKGISDAIGELE